MSNKPTVKGYSFYLNVVVIHSAGRDDDEEVVESPVQTASETADDDSVKQDEEPQSEADKSSMENEAAVVPVGPVMDDKTDPKLRLLLEGRSLVDSVFNRPKRTKSSESNKFMKDGQRLMNSIGSSLSRSGSSISKRASRFVQSKTMVSRAEKAVAEALPLVTEEIGVEMSIRKQFQQGPIFVLEVDMKGCDLFDLLSKVLGEESASHYRNVVEGLEALGLPDTRAAFISEILPKVRKGLMERLSEIFPEKMKLKKQYADLEIQCVALEDPEQFKWLVNFLAFMEDMKQ